MVTLKNLTLVAKLTVFGGFIYLHGSQ